MANIKKLPLFCRCVIQNFPFIEEDFDALTNYELICKVVEYLNKIIVSQNEVIGVANNLQESFQQLHDYVENYFDNLDVQEEINNKLDAMVEDGTLQEIITTYIQSNVAWSFDTVADMKLATNLINGSYAQTLGFHSLDDGGGALYYINDTGTANEMDVIAVGNLYAHLVKENKANVKQYGAYGDNTHDDTAVIQTAVNSSSKVIYFPEGTYLVKANTVDCPLTDTTDDSMCAITISSEKSLIGDKAVLKSYHDSQDSEDFYIISSSAKLEINGLTFNGQYSDYSHTYGVQLNASENRIYNCIFNNFGGSGVVLNGSSVNNIDKSDISHCKFQNCGNSIFCAWINDSNFSDIQFFNVSEGFDFDKKSSNVTIDNILAHTYRGTGTDACIEINGCSNFVINNVTCKNFIDGILINGKIIHTEDLNLTTVSENITISNCTFDTINGYGIVLGNAVESIDECINITMDNIIVKGGNLDGFHLRGKNISLSNSIAEDCTRCGILIDDKATSIIIDNFINNGCYKGLINCSVGTDITLKNIYDNEVNNTSNTVAISGVTNLIIDGLIVKNTSGFSVSNNRLFNVTANTARFNQIIMPVLDNAIFFITSATQYAISNSTLKLRDLRIENPTIVWTEVLPSTLGNTMPFKAGTIAIVKESATNSNAYICTRGNMESGSTVTWKRITTEAIE